MTMNIPDRKTAEGLFEWVITERNKSLYPFRDDMEETFRGHCQGVAFIAEKIAFETKKIDSETAYVMGLLHDCGRIKDEYALHEYHGVVGFNLMNELGYPKLARICLTHNFINKHIDLTLMPYPHNDMLFCQKYLDSIEYDDYDLLIQLADSMNNLGKMCTIEQRTKSISERYHVPFKKLAKEIDLLKIIKNHFEEQCNCNIYQLIGLV